MSYAEATQVQRLAENRWSGSLAENWDIVGNTNGGYMQAIAARASSETVGGRVPVAVNGHFTKPGHTGPIEVETEIVRNGRRFSVVRSRMLQDDATVLETLGTYVEPASDDPDIILSKGVPPDLPSPDQLPRTLPSQHDPFPPPSMGEIDIRLAPYVTDALTGTPPGKALVEGWFHLLDDEPMDPFALIVASDAFPPTTFVANLPIGWTPTLELSVHVRLPRTQGWLRCQFRSHYVTGGFIEEDGLFWDDQDRLVAQSRQLALVSQTSP